MENTSIPLLHFVLMSFFHDLSLGLKEHSMYPASVTTTGAYMVPRWKFFEDIAEHIPKDCGVVLELGVGTGRLMDIIVNRKKLLRPDGLFVAVDCNEASMNFIRENRPHLVADPRVHLMTDFAQNIEPQLKTLLAGRQVDVTIVSIPHILLSWPDVHRIWKMVTDLTAENGIGFLYNTMSRQSMMERYWHDVRTVKTCRAHYGIPPEFKVNIGVGPKRNDA